MSYQQERLLYSERQRAVLQRCAFEAGAQWAWNSGGSASAEARRRFPLPKIRVPREVYAGTDSTWYRVVDGKVQMRYRQDGAWWTVNLLPMEDLPLINDLLANPTEEVEA